MHFSKMHFSKMHFSKILQIFGGLVLGCIKTKFCKKICAWQHFSSSTRFASFCTAAISTFSQKTRFEKSAIFVKIQQKICKCRKICKILSNFKNKPAPPRSTAVVLSLSLDDPNRRVFQDVGGFGRRPIMYRYSLRLSGGSWIIFWKLLCKSKGFFSDLFSG